MLSRDLKREKYCWMCHKLLTTTTFKHVVDKQTENKNFYYMLNGIYICKECYDTLQMPEISYM